MARGCCFLFSSDRRRSAPCEWALFRAQSRGLFFPVLELASGSRAFLSLRGGAARARYTRPWLQPFGRRPSGVRCVAGKSLGFFFLATQRNDFEMAQRGEAVKLLRADTLLGGFFLLLFLLVTSWYTALELVDADLNYFVSLLYMKVPQQDKLKRNGCRCFCSRPICLRVDGRTQIGGGSVCVTISHPSSSVIFFFFFFLFFHAPALMFVTRISTRDKRYPVIRVVRQVYSRYLRHCYLNVSKEATTKSSTKCLC